MIALEIYTSKNIIYTHRRNSILKQYLIQELFFIVHCWRIYPLQMLYIFVFPGSFNNIIPSWVKCMYNIRYIYYCITLCVVGTIYYVYL